MGWNKRDFVATMEAGKRRAQNTRNRGQGITGKAAKGWVRPSRKHNQELAPWARLLIEVRSYWTMARDLAVEDYLRAVYPERYEVFV